ncbi:hypothetical protein BDI01nite_23530 [Brevundimonas diminuta]|nr:hypothetical protein BDI01nite_23530 [Brevundimonas diminuta]
MPVNTAVVAKPPVAKLTKAQGIDPGQRRALAVRDRLAVHEDMSAIMHITDGREASLANVMRDPIGIRERADTRISLDRLSQRPKLPAHAERTRDN